MSGTERLLDALSDGKFHSHESLYRDLGVMVHSRTANLRKKGHVIEVSCEWDAEQKKNVYWYRLGTSSEADAACAEGATGASVSLGVLPDPSGSEPWLAVGTTDAGAIDSARSESEGTAAVVPSSDPVQLSLLAVA